jgi:2-iminobutanoate/2-iminopropanoate deaminase
VNKRRSIYIAGLEHENPIPEATRIGPFLVSSGIFGKNPKTGETPPDIESQCAHMFANIRLVLEAAGATTDDIIKLTVWVKDKSSKKDVNKEWLRMFPDPKSRPARHTLAYQDLPGVNLVQCEFMAVVWPE